MGGHDDHDNNDDDDNNKEEQSFVIFITILYINYDTNTHWNIDHTPFVRDCSCQKKTRIKPHIPKVT